MRPAASLDCRCNGCPPAMRGLAADRRRPDGHDVGKNDDWHLSALLIRVRDLAVENQFVGLLQQNSENIERAFQSKFACLVWP